MTSVTQSAGPGLAHSGTACCCMYRFFLLGHSPPSCPASQELMYGCSAMHTYMLYSKGQHSHKTQSSMHGRLCYEARHMLQAAFEHIHGRIVVLGSLPY